ncbi:MAG: hypothetical protein JWM80_5644, partial [Cyanobacteria bacterium RYN_339]|nr:hypothetical protein [Cyanobacteria bacterium RYN_339]
TKIFSLGLKGNFAAWNKVGKAVSGLPGMNKVMVLGEETATRLRTTVANRVQAYQAGRGGAVETGATKLDRVAPELKLKVPGLQGEATFQYVDNQHMAVVTDASGNFYRVPPNDLVRANPGLKADSLYEHGALNKRPANLTESVAATKGPEAARQVDAFMQGVEGPRARQFYETLKTTHASTIQNWDHLSQADKLNFANTISEEAAKAHSVPQMGVNLRPAKIEMFDRLPNEPNTLGFYDTGSRTVHLRADQFANPADLINTLFHEQRHAFSQQLADAAPNLPVGSPIRATAEIFAENLKNATPGGFHGYYNQPLEAYAMQGGNEAEAVVRQVMANTPPRAVAPRLEVGGSIKVPSTRVAGQVREAKIIGIENGQVIFERNVIGGVLKDKLPLADLIKANPELVSGMEIRVPSTRVAGEFRNATITGVLPDGRITFERPVVGGMLPGTIDAAELLKANPTLGENLLGGLNGASRAGLLAPQAMLDEIGQPSRVRTGGPLDLRMHEKPYHMPPDVQFIQPGTPLDLSKLDPSKKYLWVTDPEGHVVIAPEHQAGFRENTRDLIKHGDLVPPLADGQRGLARAGGELAFDGRHWVMDNNSSYSFVRTDGFPILPAESVEKVRNLLGHYGSDTNGLITRSVY